MAEPKDSAKKPAAKKEAAKKPAAKKAAARKRGRLEEACCAEPASKKPAAKKEAAKPASTKKAAKKAAAKKGAAKPASTKKAAKKKAAAALPGERPVVRAKASYVRIAPRKARLIADQVRGMPLEDAMTTLRFSNRGAARDIAKLIGSAAANAENNHDLVADDLMVSDITVDEGPTLRRYRPRALGRATRINKRTSHIKVA